VSTPSIPLPLAELLSEGPPDGAAIEAFLAGRSFPIIDGPRVTFVHRAEADAVHLLHWIFALSSEQAFTRVEGTDLWHLTIDLRRNSRVEYKLLIERDGNRSLMRDPLNPLRAHDPYGSNSVCQTEGYERPEWTLPDESARPGRIERHRVRSAAFGGMRDVAVYVPARLRETRRYPLLLVHDGSDYMRYAALKTVLDNLIDRLEIPPMVVALLDSPARLTEYADDERHARFVVEELIPGLEELYPLLPEPSERGLLGASFGGVASLATASRYPGQFGKLLLQSGSFAFTDVGEHDRGPAFDEVVRFVNRFRKEPGRPVEKVFLSCGIYERLINENRSLVPLLQAAGMEARLVEARDGHNWENWRDQLRTGLSWLFPGPLWMVYE